MTQVNSPFLLSKIRPARELSDGHNNYLIQLERALQQLYQRSGGTTDVVEETEGVITSIAYVMSIANQALHNAEELNAFSYTKLQSDIDSLRTDMTEMEARQSSLYATISEMQEGIAAVKAELESKTPHPLDGILESIKEIEALSYGYHA